MLTQAFRDRFDDTSRRNLPSPGPSRGGALRAASSSQHSAAAMALPPLTSQHVLAQSKSFDDLELETSAFDETPQLVDALTELSRQLCDVQRDDRNQVLRLKLDAINARLLPSRAAYLPLGKRAQCQRVFKSFA